MNGTEASGARGLSLAAMWQEIAASEDGKRLSPRELSAARIGFYVGAAMLLEAVTSASASSPAHVDADGNFSAPADRLATFAAMIHGWHAELVTVSLPRPEGAPS